jgi:LCP family protein required for cell wall assembly
MYEPPEEPRYKTYRSAPRGLLARLRGESDTEQLEARAEKLSRKAPPAGGRAADGRGAGDAAGRGGDAPGGGGRGADGRGGGGRGGDAGRDGFVGHGDAVRRGNLPPGARRRLFPRPRVAIIRRPRFHPIRLIKYAITFVIFWVVLSIVLFFFSASQNAGNLPGGQATKNALSSAGPILLTPNNILILGLDNRPTTGYSSHEGGLTASQRSETDANTDSIMIWRIGGFTSRRLSIPRDTWTEIPGYGSAKINAAWSEGGPQETVKVVENLTGIKINHMIVVDLGNFPKFINDVGGVTIRTPRICSQISGGAADGGYTLNLRPGLHHLNGTQALTLARTRENKCNAAYDDYERQAMQQRILNAIKSQLFTVHTFIHLPWASWDAPKVIQTDMGPLSLMQLFVASEIGGSAPVNTLKQHGGVIDGEDVQLPSQANVNEEVNKLMNGA